MNNKLNMENKVIRYSAEELAEFKEHIQKKMERTQRGIDDLLDQINDISERGRDGSSYIDNTTNHTDYEFLGTMLNRQRAYYSELKEALQRIHNGTYGICSITGQKIAKERLFAVPTTTKSLAAKMVKKPVKELTVIKSKSSGAGIRKKANRIMKEKFFDDDQEEEYYSDDDDKPILDIDPDDLSTDYDDDDPIEDIED